MNRINVLGYLGKKPELRETKEGKKVTNLNVASTEREKTAWIEVAVWGTMAENCVKYLDKGSQVLVHGNLVQNAYEKEGKKFYSLRCNAHNVQFIGGKSKTDGNDKGQDKKGNWKPEVNTEFTADEIPF